MSQELPFEPFSWITDPHHQTIVSSLFNFLPEPPSVGLRVRVPDGDQLNVEVSTPEGWQPHDLTVLLVHGLCGSHRSPNLVRMTHRLLPKGVRCVRYNMRGCGSGKGLARQIYHSGRSEDIFQVLQALKKGHPDSPIVLVGFSLGAHLVLKLAGELGELASHYLKHMISVSPPVDLYSSIQMLGDPVNGVYERYFYKILRADAYERQRQFRDLPKINLPRSLKIYEFDQLYTAPTCGFNDVMDYYDKCSSAHVVKDIAIPCKILLAEDDPIISPKSLDNLDLPKNIDVYKTKKGGHMGYLGDPTSEAGFHWLDSQLVEWIL